MEVHDEREINTAVNAGARIVGVNNRNLKDFTVDTENSRRLRKLVPKDIIFISESGVSSNDDMKKLKDMEADGVLIGEFLMRAKDKRKKLEELKKAYDQN